MGSAAKCFCFLSLISFTLLFFNFQLMGTASFQESQNVRGDEGLHVLLKIRLLLGLKSSTLKGPAHHGYHYSPAPAPVEEVIPPGHVPQLHTHVDPPTHRILIELIFRRRKVWDTKGIIEPRKDFEE
uniref:Transmembrane protein n=1 Tax=Ananas comosus var. bracteatus TaxID=296719 RepID=A0A6V7P745_ANACO|nr:unnamed protein product [Ananas comosus var. bracteatus]